MVHLKEGIVNRIIRSHKDMIEVSVYVDGTEHKAIAYPYITGNVSIGDRVGLNTTAVDLNLGTGGYHFVLFNKTINTLKTGPLGHIMKLKYTPIQIKCHTIEEQYPDSINSFKSLDGMPIVTGSIHSMLPPVVAAAKSVNPNIKIAYIMTDGGALPISFSNTVRMLKEKKLIDCTITCGNAFGGDLETVNLYTALIAAKLIRKCNGAVIIMGPGHVGTHTKLGFTGVELANNAHTIYSMGGTPICIPRVSFSEKRNRHYGISHHFLTTMGQHCLIPCHMAFANYAYNEKEYIMGQYEKYNLGKKHIIHFVEEDTISVMERYDLSIKTMGRTIREDPEFFRTAGACGMLMTGFLV